MKTLLRYRLTDDLRSAGAALAAVVGVNILMVLFTNDRVYGSGTGAAMAFWALVVGIAALRADLRWRRRAAASPFRSRRSPCRPLPSPST